MCFSPMDRSIKRDLVMEEETTKLGKILHTAIDGMFWVFDETSRWIEIGKIHIQLQGLKKNNSLIAQIPEDTTVQNDAATSSDTPAVNSLEEQRAQLFSREEDLMAKCWEYTPHFWFFIIFMVFLYGIIAINPIHNLDSNQKNTMGVFRGQISKVRDIPFSGHSIITDSVWFNNRLYVAGNNGVSEIDTTTGISQNLKDLPKDFFARDMLIKDDCLYIAGYPGVYYLQNSIVKALYSKEKLPFNLINSIAITKKKQLLYGSLGHGLLRSNEDSAVMVPSTQNYVIKDFGYLNKELWLLHEEGILTGNTNEFKSLDLQVLAGKHLRCMVTTDKNVFIGTDQGIVAGYRSSKNWVWTILSSSNPGKINDIINAGDILFIASNEGVFRYYKGKMDRLSSMPTQSVSLCDTYLAAVSTNAIMLFYFDLGANLDSGSIFGTIPELGTYTPILPIAVQVESDKPRNSRMPVPGLLETDGKQAIGQTVQIMQDTDSDTKPMVQLPTELQRPVFSDIISFNKKYYLATENRGLWSYNGNNWNPISRNGKGETTSLCADDQHCYAFSQEAGVYEISESMANCIIEPKDTTGLKHLSLCEDQSILLLYADGNVKRFFNGEFTSMFKLPEVYKDVCHSIWRIGGQYLAVLNQGVMVQETDGQWSLNIYEGNVDSIKVADAVSNGNKQLFIALNDGRIFEFVNSKLYFAGIVPDTPVSMNFSSTIWIAGRKSLFFKNKTNFMTVPFRSSDKILGAFPESNNAICVFTTAGLKQIITLNH